MIIRYYISRRKEFMIKKAIHSANSLMIALNGEFEYTESNVTRRVLPYSPVVYKKGKAFERTVIQPIEYVMVTLSQFDEGTDTFLEFDNSDRVRLISSVDHLTDAIINNGSENVIEHFVNDILLTAGMNKIKNGKDTEAVIAYIKEHFCERLTLDTLAEIANSSKQTLRNKFKSDYKTTPIEYITKLRINKAKDLLVNSNYSVTRISEMCGYDNPYYFSNIFKKHEKLPPIKFRQKAMM